LATLGLLLQRLLPLQSSKHDDKDCTGDGARYGDGIARSFAFFTLAALVRRLSKETHTQATSLRLPPNLNDKIPSLLS